MLGGQRVDGDDGVDAATEGDERTTRLGPVGEGRRRLGTGSFEDQAAEVQAVAIGELSQSLLVVAAEEVAFGRGRWQVAQVHASGGRGLVVRHAGQQYAVVSKARRLLSCFMRPLTT